MERLDVSRVARRLDGRDGGIIIGFVEMCVWGMFGKGELVFLRLVSVSLISFFPS